MLDWFSIITLVSVLFLFLGYKLEDYPITALSSFVIFIMGLWVTRNGIQGEFNTLTSSFGITIIGIASYILIRGGYELVKDMKWKGLEKVKDTKGKGLKGIKDRQND